MGHNFGADHDGDTQGTCPNTPSSGFLMAPVVERHRRLLVLQPHAHASARAARKLHHEPSACERAHRTATSASRAGVRRVVRVAAAVTNIGGLDSRSVHAELTLPTALTVVDASVIGGSCISGGGAVECELGDIAGGNSARSSWSSVAILPAPTRSLRT